MQIFLLYTQPVFNLFLLPVVLYNYSINTDYIKLIFDKATIDNRPSDRLN